MKTKESKTQTETENWKPRNANISFILPAMLRCCSRYLFIFDNRHASEFIFYGFQMIFNPLQPEADANCMRHVTDGRTHAGH